MVGYSSGSGWGAGTMVDGYTVLSSVAAKVEKGLSAAADYVDEQISSFSWSDAEHAVPVWGNAAFASDALSRGNSNFSEGYYGSAALSYAEMVTWEAMGVLDLATAGEASKVGALLDAGGGLIAKGGRYLYGKFAVAERAAAKTSTKLLGAAPANLTQKGLDQIIARHWFTSGAKGAGKFAEETTGAGLKGMINTTTTQGVLALSSL